MSNKKANNDVKHINIIQTSLYKTMKLTRARFGLFTQSVRIGQKHMTTQILNSWLLQNLLAYVSGNYSHFAVNTGRYATFKFNEMIYHLRTVLQRAWTCTFIEPSTWCRIKDNVSLAMVYWRVCKRAPKQNTESLERTKIYLNVNWVHVAHALCMNVWLFIIIQFG